MSNTAGWGYSTTTTATTANFTVTQPYTISVAPTPAAPKGPLDWLREQVNEICQLAREPA